MKIGRKGHTRKHDIGSIIDHKGDIFNALKGALHALTAANVAVDTQTLNDAISAAIVGMDWQQSIIRFEAMVTNEPIAPSDGDRFISTEAGTIPSTLQAVLVDDVCQWNATTGLWEINSPKDGWAVQETQPDPNIVWWYSGTAWRKIGTIVDHSNLLNLNWSVAGHVMDTVLDMNGNQINEVADPILDQDAATKKYVDDAISEPNQAINLYVSDLRGNDTTGDGSSFNAFKTPQKAVDYAEANYFGLPVIIVINDDFVLIAAPTIIIPPGMQVTLYSFSQFKITINLSVSQFCWVTTVGIIVNILTELDSGDSKTVTMVGGSLDSIVPEAVPSIYMDLYGTVNNMAYSVLITQVAYLDGYFVEVSNSLFVLAQNDAPTQNHHLVNKGFLNAFTNGFKAPQLFYVSEAEGSDTLGNGWFYPFATVQKAVDVAVIRGWLSCDVYIDSTVDDQPIIVPDAMRLSLIGVNDFRHSQVVQFTSITLGNSCVLSLDNTSAYLITSAIDGTNCDIYIEESRVKDMTNCTGFYVVMANANLSAIGFPEDSVFRWKALLATMNGWDGTWCAAEISGGTKTVVSNSLNVSGGNITDVQRINRIDKINYNPVALAGVTPVDADILVWRGGDSGLGVGTTGRIFLMYNIAYSPNPAVVKYVEYTTQSFTEGFVLGSAFILLSNEYIYDIVFAVPYVDANYVILICGEESRAWRFENQTASGFRINTNSGVSLGALTKVTWLTRKI